MLRIRLAALGGAWLLALTACAEQNPNVIYSGHWLGDCALDSGVDVDLTFDLNYEKGPGGSLETSEATGEMRLGGDDFDFVNVYLFAGDHNYGCTGFDADLSATVDDVGNVTQWFRFCAHLNDDEDHMVGECELELFDYDASEKLIVDGVLDLEKF